MWQYNHSDELYHYGVKGMKWGVRRTPAQLGHKVVGKWKAKRKAKKEAEAKAAAAKRAAKEEKRRLKTPARKLSAAELKSRIERMELEKKYNNLQAETQASAKGKQFVMDVLDKSSKNIATQVTTYAMGSAVNKMAKDVFGVKNATKTTKGEDGIEIVEEIFEDIVNPRKGQKDK